MRKKISLFLSILFSDQSHELLPKDHMTNAPSIVIHTCDDASNSIEIDQSLRAKLIKPTLVQTRRPPINEVHESM